MAMSYQTEELIARSIFHTASSSSRVVWKEFSHIKSSQLILFQISMDQSTLHISVYLGTTGDK